MKKISGEIRSQILAFGIYKKAKTIAAFYSFDNETDINPLFRDSSKHWYLPRVMGSGDMAFYKYDQSTPMQKNRYGIYEPVGGVELSPDEPDLIFVPALMVDKKGHRLGYGKGYYDRFLSKLTEKSVKVVPIPEELTIEDLPADEFDIPVDFAITGYNIYDFRV